MRTYAFLRRDEDTANPVYQDMMGRSAAFLVRLSSALAFEDPELAAIPEETLEGFYAALPALEKYRRYLTSLPGLIAGEQIFDAPAVRRILFASLFDGQYTLHGLHPFWRGRSPAPAGSILARFLLLSPAGPSLSGSKKTPPDAAAVTACRTNRRNPWRCLICRRRGPLRRLSKTSPTPATGRGRSAWRRGRP